MRLAVFLIPLNVLVWYVICRAILLAMAAVLV